MLPPSVRLEIRAEPTRRGLLKPSASPSRAPKPRKPGSFLPSLPQTIVPAARDSGAGELTAVKRGAPLVLTPPLQPGDKKKLVTH